jgi:hypothetical protein
MFSKINNLPEPHQIASKLSKQGIFYGIAKQRRIEAIPVAVCLQFSL